MNPESAKTSPKASLRPVDRKSSTPARTAKRKESDGSTRTAAASEASTGCRDLARSEHDGALLPSMGPGSWLSDRDLAAIEEQLEALEALERDTDAAINLLLPAELREAWRTAELELELERVYDDHREALERGRAGECDEAMREAREAVDALEALANRECPGLVAEWRTELVLERVEATVQRKPRKARRKGRPFAQLELLDASEPRVSREDLERWDTAVEGAPLEVLLAWQRVRDWVLSHPRNGAT